MANTLKVLIGIVVGAMILLTIIGIGVKTDVVDQLGINALGDAFLKYAFVGDDEVYNTATSGAQSLGYLIMALMVWLIIFVAFGDIFENFAAFSSGIGWVIAFGVAVIAANVKVINAGVITITKWFVFAGTAAVYVGLFVAIIVFLVVSMGITPLMGWIRGRRAMISATTGRAYAREGLRTLGTVGRTAAEEGQAGNGI